MPNPFQQGEQFAVDQEKAELANQAAAQRNRGVNAIGEMFGEAALAPGEYAAVSGADRAERRLDSDLTQRATDNARIDQDRKALDEARDRERMLSAAGGSVAFLRNAKEQGIDMQEAVGQIRNTLSALGFQEDDISALPEMLASDPNAIEGLGAIVEDLRNQGKNATQRRVVQSKDVELEDGTIGQRITRADGSVEIRRGSGMPIDFKLAEDRNVIARDRLDADNIAARKAAEKGGSKAGERLDTGLDVARKAEVSVRNGEELLNLIDEGMKSGSFAKARLGTARFMSDILGLDPDPEVAATDEYLGRVGLAVAAQITAFGAGTGLSDADREFAAGIVGGNIAMDEAALRRLVELRVAVDKKAINDYNADRDAVASDNATLARQYPRIGGAPAAEVDDEIDALLNKYGAN